MKYNCTLCNQNCSTVLTDNYGKHTWFLCNECECLFKINFNHELEITRFPIKQSSYFIDLCHFLQKTHVIENKYGIHYIILSVPYLMKGITSNNSEYKFKTLMIFS